MRIEQFEYLLEISRSGSINAASEKLHLTHQSLNRSISHLEDELDVKLLERTVKGVSLTKAGQKTALAAQQILTILEELKASLIGDTILAPSSLKGALAIAISPIVASVLFPSLSLEYSKYYPLVNLSLQERPPAEIPELILTEQCDLGLVNIAVNDMERFKTHFHLKYLWSDTALVLVSKNSPLAKQQSLSIRTILNYPLILYNFNGTKNHWIFETTRKYHGPKQFMSTNSIAIFLNSIAQGHYISLFTKSHWDSLSGEAKENLRLIPFRQKEERNLFTTHIVLLTHKTTPLSPQAKLFTEYLFKEIKQ